MESLYFRKNDFAELKTIGRGFEGKVVKFDDKTAII